MEAVVPTNVAGLLKDRRSGAVINTDKAALDAIMKERQRVMEMNFLKKEVKLLRTEIAKLWEVINAK
jgi:hypothetical protein